MPQAYRIDFCSAASPSAIAYFGAPTSSGPAAPSWQHTWAGKCTCSSTHRCGDTQDHSQLGLNRPDPAIRISNTNLVFTNGRDLNDFDDCHEQRQIGTRTKSGNNALGESDQSSEREPDIAANSPQDLSRIFQPSGLLLIYQHIDVRIFDHKISMYQSTNLSIQSINLSIYQYIKLSIYQYTIYIKVPIY